MDHPRPPKPAAERCQAGASLGGEHPHPSRKARKPILPRAYSASAGLIPRSPTKTRAERCQAGASLGGDHSTPLAHSAKADPPPSLLSARRPDAAEPRPPKTAAERCQAAASLGGEHPHPSRKARKLLLPRAYSARGGLIPRSPAHLKPERSGVRPERALEANTLTPRAKRESRSFPEPTQRAEA